MIQSSAVISFRTCSFTYARRRSEGKPSASTRHTMVSTIHLLSSAGTDDDVAMVESDSTPQRRGLKRRPGTPRCCPRVRRKTLFRQVEDLEGSIRMSIEGKRRGRGTDLRWVRWRDQAGKMQPLLQGRAAGEKQEQPPDYHGHPTAHDCGGHRNDQGIGDRHISAHRKRVTDRFRRHGVDGRNPRANTAATRRC